MHLSKEINIIGLLFVLASMIVDILIFMWSIKKGKKKIKSKCKKILGIIVVIGLVLLVWYYHNKTLEQNKNFMNTYNLCLQEIENGKYIVAIRRIDGVLNKIDNDELYIRFSVLKGISLFCKAINTSNYQKKNIYFEKIIFLCQNIYSEQNEIPDEQDITLKYLLGFSYLYLDDERYDEDLKNIEKEFRISRKNKSYKEYPEIALFLGTFHHYDYFKNISEKSLNKAISYYSYFVEESNNEEFLFLIGKDIRIFYKKEIAQLYLKAAELKVIKEKKREAVDYVKKSVSVFDDVLSNCNVKKDPEIYYHSIKDQGRGYCLLAMLESLLGSKKHDLYLEKAYKNMKLFLYADLEKFDGVMQGVYIFYYTDLNNRDIDMIIKRYNRLKQYYENIVDLQKTAETGYEIAYFYGLMAEKTNNIKYLRKGKKF